MIDRSPSELEDLRAQLKERHAELTRLLEHTADASAPVTLDQTKVGRLSRMDAIQAQAMAQETRRRRASEVRAIELALQRLASGEFGACEECGEPIANARLAMNPAVTLCIQCAAAAEG